MLDNTEENIDKVEGELAQNNAESNKNDQAVEEVENKMAEDAEKSDERHEIPMLDYKSMELEALVDELQKLLQKHPVQQLKANVDAIKNAFNSKFGKLLAAKKEAFLAEGGDSIDFQFSSPIKTTYNKLLGQYKVNRETYYSQLEKQLKENLEKRNRVINELKDLIEKADTKTMYNDFKALQTRWRAIGAVPRTKYNDTWKTYHHHVERFYDLLHLSKDFRELDFKHNLEEKLKLIKQAEDLVNEEDVNVAFKQLQELHRVWKEDIGPVDKEYREDIWNKFSEITKKIHDSRHDYFRSLRSKHQEIIDAKLAVVEEIKNYNYTSNKTHSDWQKSINEIENLRKKYFNAGKLPHHKSEAVWQEFKSATNKFNSAKNNFYRNEKNQKNDNLKKKMELVELAESLKDNENWEETTNVMKRIQADWKRIGNVPRKFSDDIWKRFKEACNFYFDRLHARKDELNQEQQEVVNAKKEFLEKFKASEGKATLEQIEETIAQWKELGKLPRNSRHIDGKFNKEVEVKLEELNLGKEEIAMIKFKNIIDAYAAEEDYRKLDNEQQFIRKKIDEAVREIQQLENNLSFISNASKENPLVKNVHADINRFKESLDLWQLKLDYLKKLDY
ncbi:DUF349 domain-containing protein [Tenacibaculum sp. UWU-22]|uniref:DUF349 domain-containing protein n=1 Tax=Tenacibaculum sp. UWU-22 TaxID=3234187 RepID=UPI0034DB3B7B